MLFLFKREMKVSKTQGCIFGAPYYKDSRLLGSQAEVMEPSSWMRSSTVAVSAVPPFPLLGVHGKSWVLPPLSNSWIIIPRTN